MKTMLPDGVFPTMVTPFTEQGEIDYISVERLVEWYIERGVDGLFAVCQSSEMFFLSLDEKVQLAQFIKEKAAGRISIIASGHTSDSFEDQVMELNAMCQIGIDALVLITNRFAASDESDDLFLVRLEQLLKHIPEEMPLGFYECPHPYKRLLSPKVLEWCAQTGRFAFLKDTSCDLENMANKLAVAGNRFKIYNANSATLLESLKLGVSGYSGVMANFHAELYVWLTKYFLASPQRAEQLSDILSMGSLIEKQIYPRNAKYFLVQEQIINSDFCRNGSPALSATNCLEIKQLNRYFKGICAEYVESVQKA